MAGYPEAHTFYETGNPLYFNCIVGRVANRINEGTFTVKDKTGQDHAYTIPPNSPPHALHGGHPGLSHQIWQGTLVRDGSAIQFTYTSPDREQGFPGTVVFTVTYSLRSCFESAVITLQIEMDAQLVVDTTMTTNTNTTTSTNRMETPINLAQHAYFNLGDSQQGILDHTLQVEADAYTPVDATGIPTRSVQCVATDPVMDFRTPTLLRTALQDYGTIKMKLSKDEAHTNVQDRTFANSQRPYGFDHNYVVRKQPGMSLPKIGSLSYQTRTLSVFADTPGVQIYTAQYLGREPSTTHTTTTSPPQPPPYRYKHHHYGPWEAVCFETQYYPNSIQSNGLSATSNSKAKESEKQKSKTKRPNNEDTEFWNGKCPLLSQANPTYHQTMIVQLEHHHRDDDRGGGTPPPPPAAERSSSWFHGATTDGTHYRSIDAMWNDQDVTTWYQRAKSWYDANCPATIAGVLGGIGQISDTDLQGSRHFLTHLFSKQQSSSSSSTPAITHTTHRTTTTKTVACECGAGIGRVTKGVLLDFVDQCDLIESSSRLLQAAPEHLGETKADRCRFYCTELQDWSPTTNKYTIIWIQWTLCYLTDYDIVQFLRRCAASVRAEGWIVLKENTTEPRSTANNSSAGDSFVVDVADASITRSLEYWYDLIAKSGLQVKHIHWQKDFPPDIFPVPMLALQK